MVPLATCRLPREQLIKSGEYRVRSLERFLRAAREHALVKDAAIGAERVEPRREDVLTIGFNGLEQRRLSIHPYERTGKGKRMDLSTHLLCPFQHARIRAAGIIGCRQGDLHKDAGSSGCPWRVPNNRTYVRKNVRFTPFNGFVG